MRRPALLLGLAAAVLVVLQRRRAAASVERDLWHEATTAPDLR